MVCLKLKIVIVGKWIYKYSILSDTEYVNNNNQIQTFPWPFYPGVNPQTNYDSSFNFITFNDNGIGIESDNLDKIFNPFFTTKPTRMGNTGMGLSLSYDIIAQQQSFK